MSRQSFGAAAKSIQPLYYAEPTMAWEQRLAGAYDEASKAIASTLPSGTILDTNQAAIMLASEGDHIDANSEILEACVAKRTDFPESAAFQYTSDQSRQAYLGKFAAASQGLGAYVSGAMRDQVLLGGLTEAEFNRGAEIRLRLFSELIHLSRTGALPTVLNTDALADKSGAPTQFTIGTGGIVTERASLGGSSGFGVAPLVVAGIAIVSLLIGVGIGVAVATHSENIKDRQKALEICQMAVQRGDPNAGIICQKMGDVANKLSETIATTSLLDTLVSKDTQKTIASWAMGITGVALLIYFSPSIIKSLGSAKDAYADSQARSLAKQRKRSLSQAAMVQRESGLWTPGEWEELEEGI